jgi:hypothetical protein
MRYDNGPNEWHVQFEFFKWLEPTYPDLREVAFSISNEKGQRTVQEMSRLKMTGLTAGVPDVCICYPTKLYHGMFIEFKSAIGKLSDVQKEMLHRLESRGYKCVVCYSSGEAINAVLDYLKGNLPMKKIAPMKVLAAPRKSTKK